MANSYFRQFAIKHNLTVDYGYMYGKYRDFYISLKETLGSTKTLYIITNLKQNNDNLKKVLSIFNEEELTKYCISDYVFNDTNLQFTFELSNDDSYLIVDFLDKFIDSYIACDFKVEMLCGICQKPITNQDKFFSVDIGGILTPVHETCYETGKEEIKKKMAEKNKEINKDTKGYSNGLLGAILFGLIYMLILMGLFFLVQFILEHSEADDSFVTIFQYSPVLVSLIACPLICTGYDLFKGKKGTTKYIIILWTVIITTILGTFFGFVASLLVLNTGNSFLELLELVGRLIRCEDINPNSSSNFRWGFYIYIVVALILANLSMFFKFSGKKENDEANSNTFEKLE